MVRFLGAAAALLGEPDKARAYYHKAIEVCQKVRHRPELALSRLELAELLLAEAADLSPNPSPERRGEPDSVPPFPAREGGQGVRSVEALCAETLEHLDFAIGEFRAMKMQPSLERALAHKGLLSA